MKILAIAGSLRAASINAAFCRAAARLATGGLSVEVYAGLAELPLFNPDLETALPARVSELRSKVAGADALLIASPEYAHGVTGAMKNALDWLVSFEGFVGKPVALVNTSPRAHHAYDALAETLTTMSATIIADASVAIALLGSCVTEEEMVRSPQVSSRILGMLASMRLFLAASGAQ
ncbi:MAG: NADPH-dependent FMN reductase [Steroidobacteraceae bacterium]